MTSYGIRYDDQGLPLLEDCVKNSFIGYYTSPEVASAFGYFYQNENGVQDKFLAYWNLLSAKFANNPYVIGYDPFNEPWPADIYYEPTLLFEFHKFDHAVLQPMYKRVHSTIRQNDDSKIIFFEPAQFPDTFPTERGDVNNVGFDDTPGGVEYHNRESLNDHSYCCQAIINVCNNEYGEPSEKMSNRCRNFHFNKASTRREDADRLGIPLLFSEFGACSNTTACAMEITNSVDAFDSVMASWTYWGFKGFGDFTTTGSLLEGLYDADGNLQPLKFKALTRSYVHAFQGVPTKNYFSTDSSILDAEFVLDTSVQAATEIFFNEELFYSQGYSLSVTVDRVDVSSGFSVTSSEVNYIQLLAVSDSYNGSTVSIKLSPLAQEVEI